MKVISFIILFIVAGFSLAGNESINLIMQNPAAMSYPSWPMTTGIPFPKGSLSEKDQLSLSVNGEPVPLQCLTTSTWVPEDSVRWKLIDFQANLSGSDKQDFTLGRAVQTSSPKHKIQVKETSSRIAIDNGIFTYVIDKANFNLFSEVRDYRGQVIYQGKADSGPYVVNKDKKLFTSSKGKPDAVEVESSGTLRTVIRAEGWHYAAGGEKFCRYEVRIEFYAGQPFARIYHTYIITGDSDQAQFRDIGLKLAANAQKVLFGEDTERELGLQSYLLQYDSDRYAVSTGGRKINWDKPSGQRASGWMNTKTGNGTVLLAVKDFWQQFPKELEISANGDMIFHAWPAHGISKPEREIDDAMIQYLWFCHEGEILNFKVPEKYWGYNLRPNEDKNGKYRYLRAAKDTSCLGMANTNEILLGFNITDATQRKAIVTLFNDPPIVMAAPEWMCASGVFGRIHPYDPERFPEAEKGLSKVFDCEMRLMDHTRDYGMFNFGDGHTAWDTSVNRWSDVYRCWRAMHHGAPRVPWLLYFRSGDPKYLNRAIRNTRHVMDIDICHYSTPESEKMPAPVGKQKGALNDYKGIVHWHHGKRLFDYNSMTDFLLYYYYMTGNRRGLDVAKEWGEAVKKHFTAPFGTRAGAGVTAAVIELYKATGDMRYKEIADKMVTNFWDREQNLGQAKYSEYQIANWPYLKGKKPAIGTFPQWETYAPWAERYWELTGDKKSGERIVLWADGLIKSSDTHTQAFKDCINIMAFGWFIGKDPKYLVYGNMLMSQYLKSIENSPGSLLDGFPHMAQMSLGPGYMAQRIPYLLAAMADYGKPVEAQDMLPPTNNFNLPYRVTPAKTRMTEFWLLKEKDSPVTVKLRANIYRAKEQFVEVEVTSPRGTVAFKEKINVFNDMKPFSFTIPQDGLTGIYKVRLMIPHSTNQNFVAPVITEPVLKQIFPCEDFQLRANDCLYYFMIPENTDKFQVKITKNTGTVMIIDPDGKTEAQITCIPSKTESRTISVVAKYAGKLWSVRGQFSKNSEFVITGDGGASLSYLAIEPSLYFFPSNN